MPKRHVPPDLYLNRELGQLEFNRRVLALAEDRTIPALERLRFEPYRREQMQITIDLMRAIRERLHPLRQQTPAKLPRLPNPHGNAGEITEVRRRIRRLRRTTVSKRSWSWLPRPGSLGQIDNLRVARLLA